MALPDQFIETEVLLGETFVKTLKGSEDVMGKIIKLRRTIQFPGIVNKNAYEIRQSLANLYDREQITQEQYRLVSNAINFVCNSWREK